MSSLAPPFLLGISLFLFSCLPTLLSSTFAVPVLRPVLDSTFGRLHNLPLLPSSPNSFGRCIHSSGSAANKLKCFRFSPCHGNLTGRRITRRAFRRHRRRYGFRL